MTDAVDAAAPARANKSRKRSDGPKTGVAKYRRGEEVSTKTVRECASCDESIYCPFTTLEWRCHSSSIHACAQVKDKKLKGQLLYTERCVPRALGCVASCGAVVNTQQTVLADTRQHALNLLPPCSSHPSPFTFRVFKDAQKAAARVDDWLLPAAAGGLEAEGMEQTWRFHQEDIVQARLCDFGGWRQGTMPLTWPVPRMRSLCAGPSHQLTHAALLCLPASLMHLGPIHSNPSSPTQSHPPPPHSPRCRR